MDYGIQNWPELVSNCYISVMGCNKEMAGQRALQREELEFQREQLKVSREWSVFLREMPVSQDHMTRMLCRTGKGQLVVRTCRVEDGVEGPSGTGKELEEVLEKVLEENLEKEPENTLQ